MITLALSSWSFHRFLRSFNNPSWAPAEQELSVLEFPRVAASYGIREIEICQAHLASTDPEYLAEVRAAIEGAGCRIINVPIDVGNLADPDPARREEGLDLITRWIEAAEALGSPAVRVNTGKPEGADEAEALRRVADGYRQLVRQCARRGMLLLLENHGGLSASPQNILALLEMVDWYNFRLCPDFGNFEPERREEGLRLMLPHAAVVHAKVKEIDAQGNHVSFDLGRCLGLVAESGYSGPLSIELEGSGDVYANVAWAKDFILERLGTSERSAGERRHRVAIFGSGMIANRHVIHWRDAGAEVAAAVDVNEEVLDTFARKHDIGITSTDYAELLASQADGFDIVDVCTPPWLHAPMAIAALEAGKHVMCEKPFALSAGEADAMADAADRNGRILACRQGDTRLSRASRTIRDIVQSGALGDVYFMRLIGRSLYRPGIEYNPGAYWFLDRSRAGGGALYDWGVYDLDLLFSIFGPLDVVETTAFTFTGVDQPQLETPFDVEEHAGAMFKLRDGTAIFWERAWATHLPEEYRWNFYGTKAGLSFVPHSEVLKIDMDLHLTSYAPDTPLALDLPPTPGPGPDVYQDFLQAVDGESEPAVSGREAAQILRIIERVYEASRSRDQVGTG